MNTCHRKTFLSVRPESEVVYTSKASFDSPWGLNNKIITFALCTVVVFGEGLFLEKVLDHLENLSTVSIGEVEGEVPCVVKGDGFIATSAADDFGEQLSCEVIADNGILPLQVVVPPLLALFQALLTI